MNLAGIERRRLQAIVDADAETLELLHHSDFVLCNPSGAVWDRAYYLGGLCDGSITYDRFEPIGPVETMESDALAVLRYRSVIDVRTPGGGGRLECWHMDAYLREGAIWRCKWSQATDTLVD